MLTKTLLDVPSKLTLTALKLIKKMRLHAESAQVEKTEACANALFNIITLSMFPRNKIDYFNNGINELRVIAFKRRISNIIGEIKVNIKNGSPFIGKEQIDDINRYTSLALICGADNSYRDEVALEISHIKTASDCNLDATGSCALSKANGISYCEKRRALRFSKPSLYIELGGSKYKTIDWSPFGLLIDKLKIHENLNGILKFNVNSIEANYGGLICGRIVERNELHNKLAIDFGDISPIMLNLMHNLRTRGIHPSV